MNVKMLETEQIKLMQKAINVYGRKQKAIAENIANVENPNFKRINTDFSDVLREVKDSSHLRSSDPRHIKAAHYAGTFEEVGKSVGDQKVDLTREMSELAENQIRHEFVVRSLHEYYQKLKQAIAGKIL